MKSRNLTWVAVLTLFATAPSAMASSTWYVDGVNGSDSNDCRSRQTACQTIGYAVGLASSGDSVLVAPAIYTENLTINFNLRLAGSGATRSIIDGGGNARVVSILSTTAHVALSNLTIRNGVAAGGGGILNWGTLAINNSAISRNTAASSFSATGGGIYNSGTLTINNSTLSGNAGSANFIYGGGIYNSGALAINNSTLSGNTAAGFNGGGGGGIYNGGTARISNSTLSGNSGSPNGGGIYDGGTVTLQNSIVVNSSAGGNCYGAIASKGYNLSSDSTCNFSQAGDLNNTNPKLGPLHNNGGQTQTMALQTGSPAIDTGNPGGCTDNLGHPLKTDQRGQPRPDKEDTGGCDRGAYESQQD